MFISISDGTIFKPQLSKPNFTSKVAYTERVAENIVSQKVSNDSNQKFEWRFKNVKKETAIPSNIVIPTAQKNC